MAGAACGDSDDDEFIQALECSIHLGVIKQPKALPCMHTFCRDCLGPLVTNHQITCPMCREVCHMPVKGVDGLRNNVTVQNILDTLCVSCQKRHKKTTCFCCQQRLCNQCKIQHSSKIQNKITSKQQSLRNMAKVLVKTSQGLDQNKTKFLSQAAQTKSEVKAFFTKVIGELEAEINTLITTETERINQCQENIKKHKQEIQVALQKPVEADAAILENLERLAENITALLSTMVVSPATVSCKLDEQLVQDVCKGFVQYKPPQPGSGVTTALLQYQHVTIDYQTIGTPRKVFGQKGSGPGQFYNPTYLAVSPVSGNLVVCDRNNNRIQVFTAGGKFIREFGSIGQGKGHFYLNKHIHSIYSGGVTVTDDGEIVIADTDNHRLQVFDEAGGFVRVIGGKGSSPGYFDCPTGVACDQSEHLYICDCNNDRVQVMTMAGSVVRVITASDVPRGRWGPVDIAVCPDGDLVVVDYGKWLHVLSATGQHKTTITCGEGQDVECERLAGMAVDPQGHIVVTDGAHNDKRVHVIEKNGKPVCNFGDKRTFQLTRSFFRDKSSSEFNQSVGVAVTQDGHIIIVDSLNHRVQIF